MDIQISTAAPVHNLQKQIFDQHCRVPTVSERYWAHQASLTKRGRQAQASKAGSTHLGHERLVGQRQQRIGAVEVRLQDREGLIAVLVLRG
jgi:hypothetical protein